MPIFRNWIKYVTPFHFDDAIINSIAPLVFCCMIMVRRLFVVNIFSLFYTAARDIEFAEFCVCGEVGRVLSPGMVPLSACCRPSSGCRRKVVAAGASLPSFAGV